jgi:hypothetical protein
MPYTITYEPLNRIPGVKPKTVTKDTAAEAWALVDALHRSDEKTEIRGPHGHSIGWEELRRLAAEEAT